MSSPPDPQQEHENLERAIAALEAQRAILGDAVVEAGVAPLRERLAGLRAAAKPTTRQRKLITVLFADVSGYTALSETLDPEEISDLMNNLWSRLDRAITDNGGFIDKHIGDAVMALFGTPTAREDDPERAIRAALAMQAALLVFRKEMNVPLAMRIGLNTGPVLLDIVGQNQEFTAMGDTVNLASRLEHAAPVGGILIAADTYRQVRGLFDIQKLPPIMVKGKSEPVQVYLVKSAQPLPFDTTTRGIEGVQTPLIGRTWELTRLQEAFTQAIREGEGQVVTIVGEAGLGKSRLLREFRSWMNQQGLDVWLFQGRATQETERLPYALLRALFAFRFDIHESDPAVVIRAKLETGMVAFLGDEGVEKAHFVGHLLGFDMGDSPYLRSIREDARQIHGRAQHAMGQLWRAMAQLQPVVVFLEDVQWADVGTLNTIEYLLPQGHNQPILWVELTRPTLLETHPHWLEGQAHHLLLRLQPLAKAEMRRLVQAILRPLPHLPDDLRDLLVDVSEGNPFYVEELVKVLLDDGVIQREGEMWGLTLTDLSRIHIPPTLTGVVQARLDRLSPQERETLQKASVIGRIFWDEAVNHLSHTAGGDMLAILRQKELISRRQLSAFAETAEFMFKTVVLRDVTYEGVLRRQRREYHARVADWLERRGGDGFAGLIAEHYEKAVDLRKAAIWFGRAGQQAQVSYSPVTAISSYRQALALAEQAGSLGLAEVLSWQEGLGQMLEDQARYGEAVQAYEGMLAAANDLSDPLAQIRARRRLSLVYARQGRYPEALATAQQAEQLARLSGEPAQLELARVLLRLGWTVYRQQALEQALVYAEELLTISRDMGALAEEAGGLSLMGSIYRLMGRYEASSQVQDRAMALYRYLGDKRNEAVMLGNQGLVVEAQGDLSAAATYIQQALIIAREIGDRGSEMLHLNNLGGLYGKLGRHEAALTHLQQLLAMPSAGQVPFLAEAYANLSEVLLALGETEEAFAAANQSLALAQERQHPILLGQAWYALGQVLALGLTAPVTMDSIPAVADCFAQSVAQFAAANLEQEQAEVLRAWARYEEAQGDEVRGRVLLTEAVQLEKKA